MTLADKVILITGASSGIGAALAREVSQQGAKVVLAARNEDALKAVAADYKDALVVPTDITDRDACQRMIDQTIEHFGRLDILVNNAGLSMLSRFDEIEDFAVFERLMEVNYFGAVYCTHAALPHLKLTSGLIVGISTLAGKTGVPLRTGYSASKHALQGFLDSLRIELTGSGVDISIISPGFVDTEIRQHSLGADGQPLARNPLHGRRMMSAKTAAHIIAQAIDKRKREVLMGTQGKLLSIGRLLVPGFVDRMAYRSAYKK